MKKLAVILLLFIYGSSTAGATVHLHYCMDEFVGWSLLVDGNETCGKCGMEEKGNDGCCKDEHRHFQLKTDHQKTNAVQLFDLVFSAIYYHPYNNIDPSVAVLVKERHPLCHAPPGAGQAPLHIQNCIFLI